MSLKPKKHSEIQKIKEKMATEKSKMNTKSKLPPYTMIVSEGTKTEPFLSLIHISEPTRH